MNTFTVQYDVMFELTNIHLWTILCRQKPFIPC